jgi:hypothetical protein
MNARAFPVSVTSNKKKDQGLRYGVPVGMGIKSSQRLIRNREQFEVRD